MKLARAIVVSLSLFTVGCAAVSADTAQTSATAGALVVEVPTAPPEPKPEVKTPCPGPGNIWVAGYWDYIGGQHVWRDGRWVHGLAGYEYVRARYVWEGRAWQFHVPHWHRRAATTSSPATSPQMASVNAQHR